MGGGPARVAKILAALVVACAVLGALVAAGAGVATGQATDEPADQPDRCASVAGTEVRVATKPVEPFVFQREGQDPSGFSIELWQLIAARLGVQTTYERNETVNELLDDVEQGRADTGIAAVSITPDRQERLDFSVPMYTSGLEVMAQAEQPSTFGDSVEAVFDSWALRVALGFVALLFAAGTVVWLIERRHNPDFPHGPSGIGEGMWWALVTMATVGYGDRVTRTHWGRLFSAVWIVLGLVLVAQFTATITARLTVDRLTAAPTSLGDLSADSAVTVEGTAAAQLIEEQGGDVDEVADIDTMVARVAEGTDTVAIYDGPVLRYQAAQDPRVRVIGPPLTLDYYGIVFPPDSSLRECVDVALLDLIEDGSWHRLKAAWFGPG